MKKTILLILCSLLSSNSFAFCWDDSVDEATNIKECIKLAAQGDPEAQENMGQSYYAGTGVEKDHKKALEYYKMAASQKWMGILSATSNVGKVYSQGDLEVRDYSEAMHWYIRAAEQGHNSAQQSIGALYYTGSGVTKDLVKAYMWFTIAKRNHSSGPPPKLVTQLTEQQINQATDLADQWISEHPCGLYSEECRRALLAK